MKKYIITSVSFKGSLIIAYDEHRRLRYLSIEADMKDEQYKWLLNHLPLYEVDLAAVVKMMKSKAVEVPADTSFEAFWNLYEKKVNRKRCEPLWERLSEADRLACIVSIKAYSEFLRRSNGRAKLDPENYLKRAAWETNWGSL